MTRKPKATEFVQCATRWCKSVIDPAYKRLGICSNCERRQRARQTTEREALNRLTPTGSPMASETLQPVGE